MRTNERLSKVVFLDVCVYRIPGQSTAAPVVAMTTREEEGYRTSYHFGDTLPEVEEVLRRPNVVAVCIAAGHLVETIRSVGSLRPPRLIDVSLETIRLVERRAPPSGRVQEQDELSAAISWEFDKFRFAIDDGVIEALGEWGAPIEGMLGFALHAIGKRTHLLTAAWTRIRDDVDIGDALERGKTGLERALAGEQPFEGFSNRARSEQGRT